MKALFSILSISLLTLTTSKALSADRGCENSYRIMEAAHDLDNEADHFANQVRWVEGYSHLYDDAENLAEEAAHFHDMVERGRDCTHIREDFHYVASAWQHLQREWRHAHDSHHNRHLEEDFYYVESAFFHLRQSMRRGRHDGGRHDDGRRVIARN